MLSLREFLEKINFHEHYRVYHPNRDCLIFESYFKVHSPYYFDKKHEHTVVLNDKYWVDNDYCNDVRLCKEPDEETKTFLEKYGDHEVFSLECDGFTPSKIYKDADGSIKIEHVVDELQPNREWIDCFNIFIK